MMEVVGIPLLLQSMWRTKAPHAVGLWINRAHQHFVLCGLGLWPEPLLPGEGGRGRIYIYIYTHIC